MKNHIHHSEFPLTECVFENRNRLYGAYVLRHEYEKTMQRALLMTLAGGIAIFIIGRMFSSLQANRIPEIPDIEVIAKLSDISPQEVSLPPMPKIIPPPAATTSTVPIATQQFTTMQTVRDQDAQTNGTQIQQLNPDVAIGTQNQSGQNQVALQQQTQTSQTNQQTETVEDWAELMPVFNGGEKALYKFIQSHFTYPSFARDNDISGKVIVSFIVEKDGKVTDIRIVRSVHSSIDQEVLRVMSLLPPFKPGTQNGTPVRVRFNLPIRIQLM